MGGLNVAWASCPCPSAGRLRRNGGNPDLLIEGEQEEREWSFWRLRRPIKTHGLEAHASAPGMGDHSLDERR
jgi:hypothetical protein